MLRNLLVLFCGLLWITTVTANTNKHSTTKAVTTAGYSYVTITNNTTTNITIHAALSTPDSRFQRGKDWEGSSLTLAPYETKQVLWFSRNANVKADQLYRFDLTANHPNNPGSNVLITFLEKGKAVLGSELTTELTLPNQSKQIILSNNEFAHFSGHFWNNDYSIHARTWLPSGGFFNDYHFVINTLENNSFDTKATKKISVLSYNTQLMPFYAGVVDNLNQPDIRVKDIPKKISQYDVVILQELFDHDLRIAMINAMQANYPYHTLVVGHDTAKILTGGVMIFSKWPILKEDQIVYRASAGIDSLAAKGAIYAAINKEGQIYHVIGTHLQAGDKQEDSSTRQKQLQEMSNFIDRLNIPVDQALLMGGDFNINQFDKEIDTLLGVLRVNLSDNIGYQYSADGLMNTMSVDNKRTRIDYVFYSNAHAKPTIALNKVFILRALDNEKMWPNFELSDHFPVVGYFDFSG